MQSSEHPLACSKYHSSLPNEFTITFTSSIASVWPRQRRGPCSKGRQPPFNYKKRGSSGSNSHRSGRKSIAAGRYLGFRCTAECKIHRFVPSVG